MWDLPELLGVTRNQQVQFTAAELDQLWMDLAKDDATKAYRAIYLLAGSPKQALTLLNHKNGPAKAQANIAKLIAQLDADVFRIRETAMSKLARMGRKVEPQLRTALRFAQSIEKRVRLRTLLSKLKGSSFSPIPGLRERRVVTVLELINSQASRRILGHFAGHSESSVLKKEAAAALSRLD